MLKMEMTLDIPKQILENEQVSKKLFLEGQLQMFLFAKILKSIDLSKPNFSTCGNM